MQRITVTLDADLIEAVDGLAEVRGYAGRSETVRDLLRRGLAESRRQLDPDLACVATFTFVAEAGVRDLGQRLAEIQRGRHDLVITQVQVPLDHAAALLRDELLPKCQYYAYLEVDRAGDGDAFGDLRPTSTLWHALERLASKDVPLAMRKVSERREIYPVFRELFARREQASIG